MKKGFILWFLIITTSAYAQDPEQPRERADSTAIGKADGTLVTSAIGPEGGRIVSDDKMVELIFPDGALAKPTTISIQPTTNNAPNGTGKAYWFEPSGTHFAKPVKIIFHFTEEESEICPPEWMSLGIQDKSGKWSFMEYEDVDSTGRTLTGYIHHFSGVSNLNSVRISAGNHELRVGDSTVLELIDISGMTDSVTYNLAELYNNTPVLWYANSVLHGNQNTGRVRIIEMRNFRTYRGYRTKVIQGMYTAPFYLPKIAPVVISAEIYRTDRNGRRRLRKKVKCFINIIDYYEATVLYEFPGRVGMGSQLSDSAIFLVQLRNRRISVRDIGNSPPKIIKQGQRAGCKEFHNVEYAQGPVHVTSTIRHDSLSRDYPAEVYFEFVTAKVHWYKFQYRCRGGTVTELVSVDEDSLPIEINFIANGQRQQFNVNLGGEIKYKLKIVPYR